MSGQDLSEDRIQGLWRIHPGRKDRVGLSAQSGRAAWDGASNEGVGHFNTYL